MKRLIIEVMENRISIILCIIVILNLSFMNLSYASVNVYGPSILRSLSITVEDRRNKGNYTNISVVMDRTGSLERVCIDDKCEDIAIRFPIVRKIKEIETSRIGVLKGIMDETFGQTRLLLPFLDYQSVGCRVREEFKNENFIILTFNKTGNLSSLTIICDLEVPFNYVQK